VSDGRVVVLGSANVDFVVRLDRRPEPGETVLAQRHDVYPGGKGANQAVAAARAGAETAFVGCVGSDGYGAGLRASLAEAGVDVSALATDEAAPTGAAFISVTPEGENAIVVSAGANARLDPSAVDAGARLLDGAAVLALQLEVPLEAVGHAAELARSRGAQVVLTAAPAVAAAGKLLRLADLTVVNVGEAAALAGAERREPSEAASALRALGAAAVVVTLGGDGALLVDADGRERRLPAFRAGDVVDTTAAGDALAGVLAARIAAGDDLAEALRLAVVAAGISITRAGAQPSLPTLDEIMAAAQG
jgi:ribokinase